MYKAKNKKKAFTLTELLLVVIVIGVLSAAVLPKFNKVIETRKTTEAEELMGSIRTEQEKRCALDKNYLTDLSNLPDIVKKSETKNYSLTLKEKGIIASSKGSYSYNLQMPSYLDGRICCEGEDCEKLNKNYPKCEGFSYEPSPDSCAGTVEEPEPALKECSGPSERACGCKGKGTQKRTCNTTTGQWSEWGACSVADECECTGEKKDRQACTAGNTCGFETRTAACDTTTGEWEYGSWNKSACAAKPSETPQTCSSCGGEQSVSYTCNATSGVWDKTLGECDKLEEECEECVPGRERISLYNGPDTCDGDSTNRYSARVVLHKFECYDVYAGESSVSSGSTCTSDNLPSCSGGTVRRCVNGQWKCQDPLYDDCNYGGPCNEQVEGILPESGLLRSYVDKVTVCPMEAVGGVGLDVGVGCTLVGQACTVSGIKGHYINDIHNSCCCEPDCNDPNLGGNACIKLCERGFK